MLAAAALRAGSTLNDRLVQWTGITDEPTRTALHVGLRAVEGLPILFLVYLVARGLRALSRRATENAAWDLQLTLLVSRLVFIGIIVLGVLAYVNFISGPLAGLLVGGVGLLGLAFGLAFQDVLKNFLSGIFLLLERPFRIGDEIKVGEFAGRVETVRLRVTVLKAADGQMIMLPNQQVYTSAIVNATGYPARQFQSAVRVPEKKVLAGLIRRAAAEVSTVEGVSSQPPPVASLVPHIEFGTSLEARYWIDYRAHNPLRIQREVNARLLHLVGDGAVLDVSELEAAVRPGAVSDATGKTRSRRTTPPSPGAARPRKRP
jgi:small conductance mechanosensitive channel